MAMSPVTNVKTPVASVDILGIALSKIKADKQLSLSIYIGEQRKLPNCSPRINKMIKKKVSMYACIYSKKNFNSNSWGPVQ